VREAFSHSSSASREEIQSESLNYHERGTHQGRKYWGAFYGCCVYLGVSFDIMTCSGILWNISGCCCAFLAGHLPIQTKQNPDATI